MEAIVVGVDLLLLSREDCSLQKFSLSLTRSQSIVTDLKE